jgi:hypothetical protein
MQKCQIHFLMHNASRTIPLALFWDYIAWNKIENKVYQTQTRIVKYIRQGKLRLVRKLQRLLRHSYYTILLAIKRVTSNKGKNGQQQTPS